MAQNLPVWGAQGTVAPPSVNAARMVAGARAQIGTIYDDWYVKISYPGGDVAADRGACTDVVIRALRAAGFDLQRLIHEDVLREPQAYGSVLDVKQADPNIDHRRTRVQMIFLGRHGRSLPLAVSAETRDEWRPGDLVYWEFSNRRLHTGVLTDRINAEGFPLVIHNENVCREADHLNRWKIIGHFRFPQ